MNVLSCIVQALDQALLLLHQRMDIANGFDNVPMFVLMPLVVTVGHPREEVNALKILNLMVEDEIDAGAALSGWYDTKESALRSLAKLHVWPT